MTNTKRAPIDFDSVLEAELQVIKRRRRERKLGELIGESARPTGLALSGGGIRSAATCLGVIQALRATDRLESFDYLSTVSGGGYTGASLSAAMSEAGGGAYPFGDDVSDSPAVAHIRNYSNYLLPRSRSAIRNCAEAAAILLRGLLANAVCVLAFGLIAVVVTDLAFPSPAFLQGNFILRLLAPPFGLCMPFRPFLLSMLLGGCLVLLLTLWAMLRSMPRLDRVTSDTASWILGVSYVLLLVTLIVFFLDLQPFAIAWFIHLRPNATFAPVDMKRLTALAAFVGTVAGFASNIGKFLETSERSRSRGTVALRIVTKAVLILAALILPFLIWVGYVALSAWVITGAPDTASSWASSLFDTRFGVALIALIVTNMIMWGLRANGYSLHRLYRDRLSKAFLVGKKGTETDAKHASSRLSAVANRLGDLPPLDRLKLSALTYSKGPYPLINAALNVEGSLKANKRGRNADFFSFSPQHIGSALTGYACTKDMEDADSRLDLATAMAISGAAVSANMGGSTIRVLSPTLSLLNIRLGYYLKNPRYLYERVRGWAWIRAKLAETSDRFFLIIEMFNGLTERRRNVYLTDGGHIENLGIYALLQRRCRLIVAIDAEADPELSCEAMLRVERYARIDLGVLITLPWEAIARHASATAAKLATHDAPCDKGPHIAIGRITYPAREGEPAQSGVLVYVKSSLSGDEKDYILDYARRNPAFPHETTGDQFFSEEQFEMYRALGFHMLSGLFCGDRISVMAGPNGFEDEAAAHAEINLLLPKKPDSPPSS